MEYMIPGISLKLTLCWHLTFIAFSSVWVRAWLWLGSFVLW